jgi:glycosyltransferase involved in cell wall biosynthesis
LEIAKYSPDVLFVPAHVLPVIHPRSSLVTVHDLGYLHFPDAHPWHERTYLDLSTRWNARAAQHILADSCATKADLVTICGTPPEKISVVYPGVDEALAPEADKRRIEAVKARYGIDGGYFLFIGTLQPRKNLSRLIDAFDRLRTECPEDSYTLVLAGGPGWRSDKLAAQVRRLNLKGRVRFPGYIPGGDKGALLSGALAFVFPSLYEGFGLPVLEAQACGCPVIASTTSSLPEVTGEAGILVDPTDTSAIAAAMKRAAADSRLRGDLVNQGLANVRRFTWTACARSVMAAIELCHSASRSANRPRA